MRKRGMPTDPIERASAVASDYDVLQGLITLGAGLGLILMALAGDVAYGAALVAVAVPVGQGYYFKKYGKVRQTSNQLWVAFGSAVALVAVTCMGIIADVGMRPPVMLGPLAAAVAMFLFGRLNFRHVGVTGVHVGVVGVLAVSSLLPLTGLVASGGYWKIDLWLMGLALIVIGAIDHMRLTNAMRPVTGD